MGKKPVLPSFFMSIGDRIQSFLQLGGDVNKVDASQQDIADGVVGELKEELTVETPDEDLLQREKAWVENYTRYDQQMRQKQERNERYWRGEHDEYIWTDPQKKRTLTDNKIYEALETFLPQATRQNPEPIVSADDTQGGQRLADHLRKMLYYLSDTLGVRLKVKQVVRNWALYYLGVGKVGWDLTNNEILFKVVRPQKLILDPTATVEEGGNYTGEYIGEVKKDKASNLVNKFPDKEDHIRDVVKGKMGTQVQYREWWADGGEIVFWTLQNEVLSKARNPHWNYQEEVTQVDEFGNETTEVREGRNHFKTPQFPYIFLSVFNLGVQPHDDTNLIEQNLPLQDIINKRQRQIDRNVDDMNGGWAISGDRAGISKEQASKAIEAFRKGQGVWIPQGDIGAAVQRITGTGLPADVFNQLQDARNELRSIFGVQGSTPQGIASEDTARGKIIAKEQDDTRIGGGVAEYIEQFADRLFNWMVQLIMVYYDEQHIASVMGQAEATEYIAISSQDIDRQVAVSVKEGSMIPKDPLTKRNEAIDLWNAQAIDPITLHQRLDMPNPRESAKRAFMWQAAPQQLFPEMAQQQQEQQAEQQQAGQAEQQQPVEEAKGREILSEVPLS